MTDVQLDFVTKSLEFFSTLVKAVTFRQGSNKYSKEDEKTALKIIELVRDGFIIPSKIKTLTLASFTDLYDELIKASEQYGKVAKEFTDEELIDDKNYKVREAAILSFLVLIDATRNLSILGDLDREINRLTLREYLYIYRSHLHLLNAVSGVTNVRLALMMCGDACKDLREELSRLEKRGAHYNWYETLLVPMAIMGLSSSINLEALIGERNKLGYKTHMVTGLGLYVLNILKSYNPRQQLSLDRAKYRVIVKNLNSIFELHKQIVTQITETINEAPLLLYSKYTSDDKTYGVGLLELDLINFMLSLHQQYNEMLNNVKISLENLSNFPRVELGKILDRIAYI